ncbi:MAG: hypothetical protein ACLR23_16620 [Clostridia bacterium]
MAERPLDVYYDLFRKQKLRYETQSGGLPLVVLDPLQPGTFSVAGNISSQFITGLLLALPLLQQDSVIEVTAPLESIPYVDLTLQVLRTFGITVEHQGYERFQIPGDSDMRRRSARWRGLLPGCLLWPPPLWRGRKRTVSGGVVPVLCPG